MDFAQFDQADGSKKEDRGAPLTHAGEHILEVVDIRENNGGMNTPGGYGFFVDFKVVSGPTPEGFLYTKKWFPMAPPKPSPKTGKSIPQNVKTNNDFNSMKRFLGAMFGIDPKNTDKLKTEITNVVLRNSISSGAGPTTLKGRRVRAIAKGYNGANGPTTFVDDVFPLEGGDVPAEVTQVKAVAPVPPALERFPYNNPQFPGHTYDATGAIFNAAGVKVN